MAIKSEKNQKLMVVMISILLAFFLWLYVMGEKNPVQNKAITNVPVVVTKLDVLTQAGLVIVPDQKFNLDLNVTGRAFDISKITMSDIRLEADMSRVKDIKKGYNNVPINVVFSQKGATASIKDNQKYISVKFDVLVEKSVPVIVNVRGNVKAGYGYTKPLVRPDEIKISGPAAYVETVFAAMGEININGNSSNVSGSIPLTPQDKNGIPVSHINVTPKYVDATVSIKPSKEVPIKINTYGVIGAGKIIRDMKAQINRIVIIGDSNYLDKINEINTTALDLSKITSSTTIQIALNVPMGINVVDGINSINVDLSVENKLSKVITLPININNPNIEYNYTMTNQEVSVSLEGPESVIKVVDNKSLNATVDVGGFTEGSYVVPITVGETEGVQIRNLSPGNVTIEITKK